MAKYIVLKCNYVIASLVMDENAALTYVYPEPHDAVVHDPEEKIGIGYWFEQSENIFYVPVGIPPDSPLNQ